ncbi:MAG: hypothetical protein V1858_05470 [Candidatus Gottesmanbacteria bacterium]
MKETIANGITYNSVSRDELKEFQPNLKKWQVDLSAYPGRNRGDILCLEGDWASSKARGFVAMSGWQEDGSTPELTREPKIDEVIYAMRQLAEIAPINEHARDGFCTARTVAHELHSTLYKSFLIQDIELKIRRKEIYSLAEQIDQLNNFVYRGK